MNLFALGIQVCFDNFLKNNLDGLMQAMALYFLIINNISMNGGHTIPYECIYWLCYVLHK